MQKRTAAFINQNQKPQAQSQRKGPINKARWQARANQGKPWYPFGIRISMEHVCLWKTK
jgi:hypothetical protein